MDKILSYFALYFVALHFLPVTTIIATGVAIVVLASESAWLGIIVSAFAGIALHPQNLVTAALLFVVWILVGLFSGPIFEEIIDWSKELKKTRRHA